jgi:hypothetical protein
LSDLEALRDDSDDGSDDDDADDSSVDGDSDSDDGSNDDSDSDDSDDGSNDDNANDSLDDRDVNPDRVVDEPSLADDHDVKSRRELRRCVRGMQRNPLSRARRIVRLIRSSDQHREGFQEFVKDGNQRGWFIFKEKEKEPVTVKVPQLELLRDVKTRWDSTYLMLQRLRELRPVSSSQ